MSFLPEARAPEGLRLYAIGDVHGCLDPLRAVHAWIEADLAAHPAPDWRIIHLGDYTDRGPESRQVIEFLAEAGEDPRVCSLFGNHDELFVGFLEDPSGVDFDWWLQLGGAETIASFEPFDPALRGDLGLRRAVSDRMRGALSPRALAFLAGLPTMLRFGDYAFVHGGVRPGVPLAAQDPQDLIWIREPFLSSDADFGAVIVHGHTPVPQIDVRPNRIGVDTGCVFGGPLSCVMLEGQAQWHITAAGRAPLG